jgi:hypothetical protein
MGNSVKTAPSPAVDRKSQSKDVAESSSGFMKGVDAVFGLIDRYGLAALFFGTLVLFLWLLYAIDFASV